MVYPLLSHDYFCVLKYSGWKRAEVCAGLTLDSICSFHSQWHLCLSEYSKYQHCHCLLCSTCHNNIAVLIVADYSKMKSNHKCNSVSLNDWELKQFPLQL